MWRTVRHRAQASTQTRSSLGFGSSSGRSYKTRGLRISRRTMALMLRSPRDRVPHAGRAALRENLGGILRTSSQREIITLKDVLTHSSARLAGEGLLKRGQAAQP